MNPAFVHLHLHTEFSLANSVIRIKTLIDRVRELGMPAVAITDQNNIYGLVKFYQTAMKAGVKPLIGADIWVEQPNKPNEPDRLVLLAQDINGYHALCFLLSGAHREGQHGGRPCVRKEWLRAHNKGLVALSAAQEGELGRAILTGTVERIDAAAEEYAGLFPDRFYVELRRIGAAYEQQYFDGAIDVARRHQLPVVATNSVHFLHQSDFDNHEVRVCIHDSRVLNDQRRPKRFTVQQYLRSPQEMLELFSDVPEALENTVEIARRCNFVLDVGDYHLPNFPVPTNRGVEEYLGEQARQGLRHRLAALRESSDSKIDSDEYAARLELELDVINQMGFPGYFLIVADFIAWAKSNDIPVGPGRGSGAGSIAAWALGITELDPIHHGLLFERFLNPERVSLPDFDIDFCMDGRDRVIDYVAGHYGRDRVSQIITHGTLAARAAVRDVGRVLGMSYGYVDKIAKLIPFEVGMTLDKALEQEELLRERYEQDEDIRELLDIAKALEGLARNVGKHAGGVVIAPSPLTEFTALYCDHGSNQMVTQFDKDDLEAIGLVKFDFLGLRTLTIIDRTIKEINRQRKARGESVLSLEHISMDDDQTYGLLKECRTTALFQLESRGMKDLIKRLRPDRFEDLVALVALYRPGPLQSGMVDDFINRKHGRAAIQYPHPDLEPILKPTYGVILYQEQVMEIAKTLAGYSLGTADLLRRAMGKKKTEEMARQREGFVQGARERGVSKDVATRIFDLMEKFAGYGFNKSHSAAYALITYQTAWLKAHYPAQFMAASMSADMEHTDKVVTLIAECRDMGLQLISPDINQCFHAFTAAGESKILYGLGAVKGIGHSVIEAILEAREAGGPFRDLFDLCSRVDSKRINRRALESLIQAGAMDQLGAHRASLMATLPTAISIADQQSLNRSAGQSDLFGVSASGNPVCRYQDVPEWPKERRLTAEKDTLGLYLSGHPIDGYRDELDQIVHYRLVDLNPSRDRVVVVAGLIVGIRTMNTRRGERMAFVTLDDQTARIELAVFAESFSRHRDILRKDNLLVVQGQVVVDDYTGGFKMAAEYLYDIDMARDAFADKLIIHLDKDMIVDRVLAQLDEILKQAERGNCPVWFQVTTASAVAKLRAADGLGVAPRQDLLTRLRAVVGDKAVQAIYRKTPVPGPVGKMDSAA
jgi:DNA polymerase-3 subunit alpha